MSDAPKRDRIWPEEIATILDCVADGVFTVNRDFVITSFNRAAERITGFAAEEAIGQRCYNIFRTTVCQEGCLLAESIETGREISGLEMTILDRQNQEVPISVSTATLRDADGHHLGGVETFRDLRDVTQLRREVRGRYAMGDMLSKNHHLRRIFALVPDIAASTASVLIQGETGTGKELLARAIHNESPRHDRPFVEVNCGALPDTLLESELFGHVAGAFTDARQSRKGRFSLADGGTVFLDEVGDMSPAMQVKLLRVLQEGTFEPVGSSESRSVDIRVIAATHRDLRERVASHRFRQDLFYRINTVQLILPPLRERREDIPLLVEHFVDRFQGLTGKEVSGVSGQAMTCLMHYSWPGNVRELEHAIEHAFVLVQGGTINLNHLPPEVLADRQATPPIPAATSAADGAPGAKPDASATQLIHDAQRQALIEVLERNRWNKGAASRALGISRSTLWRRMRQLDIPSS